MIRGRQIGFAVALGLGASLSFAQLTDKEGPAAAPGAPSAPSAPTSAIKKPKATASSAPSPARPRGAGAKDRNNLDAAQITGNRELPKVLYIVPWKRPDLGDLQGKPGNSLLDEVLAPVDRDVFRRENRYFRALQPTAAPAGPAAAPGSAAAPAPDQPTHDKAPPPAKPES